LQAIKKISYNNSADTCEIAYSDLIYGGLPLALQYKLLSCGSML